MNRLFLRVNKPSIPEGLMNMIVEPYLDGRVPDVIMIPIGISYERTLEEELFARELLGVPKPKESTGVSKGDQTGLGGGAMGGLTWGSSSFNGHLKYEGFAESTLAVQ